MDGFDERERIRDDFVQLGIHSERLELALELLSRLCRVICLRMRNKSSKNQYGIQQSRISFPSPS